MGVSSVRANHLSLPVVLSSHPESSLHQQKLILGATEYIYDTHMHTLSLMLDGRPCDTISIWFISLITQKKEGNNI